jgi:hypothetical protein
VAAAITGIIPLRVLFSGATLRDPAGHAKAPGVAGRHASRVPSAAGKAWVETLNLIRLPKIVIPDKQSRRLCAIRDPSCRGTMDSG